MEQTDRLEHRIRLTNKRIQNCEVTFYHLKLNLFCTLV